MVGQYISIEKAIADTKESYYKALADADKLWHEEKNDWGQAEKHIMSDLTPSVKTGKLEFRIDGTDRGRVFRIKIYKK